ncbi:hypothetical protein WJX72_005052 [[Myrmecia] bisecta]|uniref:Uncharacterized protein n=1 Tax=[Myrmecia] bisecta TaxID=41462 RepID=A0AAW1PK05_9CHLO
MAPKNQGSKSHSSSFLSRVPTAHGRRSLDTLQDAPYMSSLAIPLASDAQLTSDDELDTPRLWTKASPLVDDSPGGSPNPNHNPPPFGSLPDIQALWSSARKAASGQMHCRSHSVTGAVPGASEAAVAATRDDRLAAVRQLRFARSEREAADVAVRHVQTDRASLEEGLQSAVLRAQQVAAEQQRVLAELEAAQEALHDADVRCQTLEAQLQAEVGKREALEAQNRAAADELSEERRKRTSLLGTLEFIKHKALRVSPLEIADQQRDSHAAGSGSRPGSQRQHAMRHSVDSMPSTRLRQLRSQRQGVDLPLSQQQPEPNAQLVFRHSVNGPLLPQPSSATAVHANAVGSHSWANSKLNADPSSQEDQPPEMAATPDVLRHSVHSMSNSTGTWPALIPSASPMICGEPIGDAPKPQDVTDAGGASCGQNPDNRELSTEPSVASAAWPAYDAVYNNVGTADLASSVALKSAHTTAIAGTVASHTASGLPGPAHNAQASLGSEQAHPESSVAANQPLPAVQATVGNQQNYQQSTAAATQELSTSHGSNDLDREEQARQPDSSYNVELLQALAACEELLRAEQEENDELHRQVQRAEREQAALLDRLQGLQSQLVAAVGRADSSEAMCTSLAEELERWDQYPAQIAALHDLLAAQASELEELRVEVVQLTEARDAAQAHAGSTQEDLAQMQRHLRQADEGCVEAEMHAATLQNQLDAALADQQALNQRCQTAAEAREHAEFLLAEATCRADAASAELAAAQSRIQQLEAELADASAAASDGGAAGVASSAEEPAAVCMGNRCEVVQLPSPRQAEGVVSPGHIGELWVQLSKTRAQTDQLIRSKSLSERKA